MNLLLLQYNNYFNRTIKKESSYTDYVDAAENYGYQLSVNFNPNDGVNTEQIVNWKEPFEPDYCVCIDENNNINSRWYVIEWVRLRNGQYKMTLKRDSIVDNLNAVLTAPVFIEKATIKNTDDVSCYNSEGMQFNQIKQGETKLWDETGKGWIVGYFAPNTADKTIQVPSTELDYIYQPSRSGWDFHDYESNDYKYAETINITLGVSFGRYFQTQHNLEMFLQNGIYDLRINYATGYNACVKDYNNEPSVAQLCESILSYAMTKHNDMKKAFIENQNVYKNEDELSRLDGRYIYFADEEKFYQISVVKTALSATVIPTKGSIEEQKINEQMFGYGAYDSSYEYPNTSTGVSEKIANTSAIITGYNIRLSLNEVTLSTNKTRISANAKKLSDAPYKMFCIPYGEVNVKLGSSDYPTLSEKEALNVATCIARDLGSDVYDLQLLPYCPLRDIVITNGIDLTGLSEGIDYEKIKDEQDIITGFICYCPYSSFTFDILVSGFTLPATVVDFKVENETRQYRLLSPNGSSQFDFKLTKTGSFSTVNIDCTYKPYNPYMHINPDWHRLYGEDFNDYRGLICQGDFSIPVINDAWVQYQLNNKNYLNAFNRETESLEMQWGYQRIGNILGAFTGAMGAGVSGSLGGKLLGSGIGAGIGAGIGGVASLGAGIADIFMGEALHQEQMDLRKDQFNYSLQNIQARPQTLAKTSALDYNNRIVPVIEYYAATTEEENILKDKMKYEGMTVMKISTIQNYLSEEESYIRGNLIKLENIASDYHLVSDIKKELLLGIRIKE